jgi:pyruvate-formate lyase-activating enzyme
VLQVDPERRQDLRLMQPEQVAAGIQRIRQKLPDNRLRQHLEGCALNYGCPAGKNFFLGRYEAPLPTARICNADCLGCLSLQKQGGISCSQERIAFTPTPEEIAGVALVHIHAVPKAIVSFGQGCEGDPLLAADAIEPAIKLIRKKTSKGTIHLNTNGSLPSVMNRLIAAGLDSVRISINSFRDRCYQAYFRPKGYEFEDVIKTIENALAKGLYVSINYLNMPGVSDCPQEAESLIAFLSQYPIQRIQWRNLNYDPIRYGTAMQTVASCGEPMGIRYLLKHIHKKFPHLSYGYFNPPKERW